MSARYKAPPAPYRYCWHCTRLLWAGGRAYSVVKLSHGTLVYVHKTCVESVMGESMGAEVVS